MAGTFPTLSSGCSVLSTFTRAAIAPVRVVQFGDDSEQRWATFSPLGGWTLDLTDIGAADLTALRDFQDLQKGGFDTTWTFSLDSINYTGCTFEVDEITWTETTPNLFSARVAFRQTRRPGDTAAAPGSLIFPSIRTGVITQMPFETGRAYESVKVDLPTSRRIAAYTRTTPLHRWSLRFPAITKTEALTLFNFFIACGGKLRTFQFDDPVTSTAYFNVRFDMDAMEIQHSGPNRCSTTVLLREHS